MTMGVKSESLKTDDMGDISARVSRVLQGIPETHAVHSQVVHRPSATRLWVKLWECAKFVISKMEAFECDFARACRETARAVENNKCRFPKSSHC